MLGKLDIINSMLASVGIAPLNNGDIQHPDYIRAARVLDAESRTVQNKGWWFNKSSVMLRPNEHGEIILPSTALYADPLDPDHHLVTRGNKLYDPKTASYAVGKTVDVELVENVPYDLLPVSAYNLIAANATYRFYLDEDGTEPKLTNYNRERATALAAFRDEHIRTSDVNHFNSPEAIRRSRYKTRRRLPL